MYGARSGFAESVVEREARLQIIVRGRRGRALGTVLCGLHVGHHVDVLVRLPVQTRDVEVRVDAVRSPLVRLPDVVANVSPKAGGGRHPGEDRVTSRLRVGRDSGMHDLPESLASDAELLEFISREDL